MQLLKFFLKFTSMLKNVRYHHLYAFGFRFIVLLPCFIPSDFKSVLMYMLLETYLLCWCLLMLLQSVRFWEVNCNTFLFNIMHMFSSLNCRFLLFMQTDRAAMLDEIVDYVKFLRLQVKVKFFQNMPVLCRLELIS